MLLVDLLEFLNCSPFAQKPEFVAWAIRSLNLRQIQRGGGKVCWIFWFSLGLNSSLVGEQNWGIYLSTTSVAEEWWFCLWVGSPQAGFCLVKEISFFANCGCFQIPCCFASAQFIGYYLFPVCSWGGAWFSVCQCFLQNLLSVAG